VRTKVSELTKSLPLLIFFSSIGFGFMLIEISQLTRLSIFLGHPVFGLTVVLFTLLVSSGLGSLTMAGELKERDWLRLVLAVVALAVVAVATPFITASTAGSPLLVRILLSAVVLSIPGFFMGMALPLGMLAANNKAPQLAPWLWGMNGATSVLGSVIATLVCVAMGVQATFIAGIICYVICLLSFLCIRRSCKS
jgi:MFS family permease